MFVIYANGTHVRITQRAVSKIDPSQQQLVRSGQVVCAASETLLMFGLDRDRVLACALRRLRDPMLKLTRTVEQCMIDQINALRAEQTQTIN